MFSKFFAVCFLLLTACLTSCEPAPAEEKSLEEIVRKINTKCPVMIDSETRLEYLRVLPGGLQYTYRLVHLSEIKDTVAFKNLLWPGLLAAIRTDPDLKSMRDKSYTIVHRYESMEGKYLMAVRITPGDYGVAR